MNNLGALPLPRLRQSLLRAAVAWVVWLPAYAYAAWLFADPATHDAPSYIAASLTQAGGDLPVGSVYGIRYGATLPLTLAYLLGGAGWGATLAGTMPAGAAALFLVIFVAERLAPGTSARWLGGALALCTPALFLLGGVPNKDLIEGVAGACVLSLLAAPGAVRSRPVLYAAGALLTLGYLGSETTVRLLPALVLAAGIWWAVDRESPSWLVPFAIGAGGAYLIAAGLHAACGVDPFWRENASIRHALLRNVGDAGADWSWGSPWRDAIHLPKRAVLPWSDFGVSVLAGAAGAALLRHDPRVRRLALLGGLVLLAYLPFSIWIHLNQERMATTVMLVGISLGAGGLGMLHRRVRDAVCTDGMPSPGARLSACILPAGAVGLAAVVVLVLTPARHPTIASTIHRYRDVGRALDRRIGSASPRVEGKLASRVMVLRRMLEGARPVTRPEWILRSGTGPDALARGSGTVVVHFPERPPPLPDTLVALQNRLRRLAPPRYAMPLDLAICRVAASSVGGSGCSSKEGRVSNCPFHQRPRPRRERDEFSGAREEENGLTRAGTPGRVRAFRAPGRSVWAGVFRTDPDDERPDDSRIGNAMNQKQKTTVINAQDVNPEWVHVDAAGQIVGRLATRIAMMLMGKHKPTYTPHVDTGDFVVVTNAEKVVFTGRKWADKKYYHHTNWVGGLVETPAAQMRARHPERILALAVQRMLPKTRLGRKMFKKLKIYAGPEHPHAAQQPRELDLAGK